MACLLYISTTIPKNRNLPGEMKYKVERFKASSETPSPTKPQQPTMA